MKTLTFAFVLVCLLVPVTMTVGCGGSSDPVVLEGEGLGGMTEADEEAYEEEMSGGMSDEDQN